MKTEIKTVLGVAYLLTIITVIFSLFSRLPMFIAYRGQLGEILLKDSPWFVIVAIIIFVLYKLNVTIQSPHLC